MTGLEKMEKNMTGGAITKNIFPMFVGTYDQCLERLVRTGIPGSLFQRVISRKDMS